MVVKVTDPAATRSSSTSPPRPAARPGLPARRRHHPAQQRRPRPRHLLGRPRPCRAAGTSTSGAPSCDGGSPVRTSTSRPVRPSPAPSPTARTRRSSSRSRPTPTRSRRTSPSRPAATAQPGPDFSLADDQTNDSPATSTPAPTRSSETVPAGWDLDAPTAPAPTGTNSTRDFSLQAGETVTCTFTNPKRGQIVVVKESPTPTATRQLRLHPAAASTPAPTSPTRRRPANSGDVRCPAPTRSPSWPSGWDLTSGSLRDPTAARVDRDSASRPARPSPAPSPTAQGAVIVVEKQTDPNGSSRGCSTSTLAANLDARPGLHPRRRPPSTKSYDVDPGTYTVDELAESGWDLTSISCDDAQLDGTETGRDLQRRRRRDRHLHLQQPRRGQGDRQRSRPTPTARARCSTSTPRRTSTRAPTSPSPTARPEVL